MEKLKLLYDHQIFKRQSFGGVSRYFNELTQFNNSNIIVDKIDPAFVEFTKSPSLANKVAWAIQKRIGKRINKEEYKITNTIAQRLEKGDFDIFHPTYYNPYFLEYVKRPFVLTVYDMLHEIYGEYFHIGDKTSYNKRLLCEKANQIIAISETTRNDLIDVFKVPQEKINIVHLATNFHQIIPTKPSKTNQLNNYILYTGGRGGYKNFYFTIIALSEILKVDKSLQLLCTGLEFDYLEKELFKELGIVNQVFHIYLKTDEELAWAYQNAQCFIFPSLYEGFGFPLLEAFTSNCPVVCSFGGSLKEIGGTGALFFNPKKITEIQDCILKALYDKKIRASLIENGKTEYLKYSWSATRSKTLDVYQKVIAN